jgi:hypothetical protein
MIIQGKEKVVTVSLCVFRAPLNEIDGLKNVFKPVFDVDFLKSQYYNYQAESFVSGSANSTPTATGTRRRFSIIDVIATKFKDIWNYDAPATADVETGTIKEGMDSGLTYKAYSGYVDSRFLIKIISTINH